MAGVGTTLINVQLLCISRTTGHPPVCRNKVLPKMLMILELLSAMTWMSDSVSWDLRAGMKTHFVKHLEICR